MEYFPIFIDLHEKSVLVIGQYKVLEFKIEKMIEAGAKIIYLTEKMPDKLEKHIKSGTVIFRKDKFDKKHLDDIWLVVCGSSNNDLKKEIAQATAERNLFCNFVDEAPISSFISPSVIAKGDLTIAISTKGKSPALNKYLKNKIMNHIGDEYIHFAEILGKMRPKVIENIPGQKRRGELFDSIVQNPAVLDLIKTNKYTQAENLVEELIEKEINLKKRN